MKLLLILSLSYILCPLKTNAQETIDDPFVIKKRGLFNLETVVEKSGFTLTQSQIFKYLSDDPQMKEKVRPLSRIYFAQSLTGATGSVLAIWPLLQLGVDKEPNFNFTEIGLGVLAVSMVLKVVFMNRASSAMKYFNNGYQETGRLAVRPLTNGAGIAIAFH